jgi:hypothetical protein
MVSGIASALLVAGCASTPNISLDKSKIGPITTASLLLIPESRQVMVRNLSGLSGLGGALGGVIAGSAEVSRNEAFLKEYNQGTTRLSTALADDLQRELSASGIQVSYTPSEFAKLKDGVDDYSHVNTDKDAILSVWFGPVGFIADGVIDAPYEPWVVVHVRLLHSTTKQILSQKTYTSGYKAKTDGAVFVPCATDYRFATFEKLMSEFAQSVEALAECNSAVARQAAQDLN